MLSALLLSSCVTTEKDGPPAGKIYVSRASVSTRERLLNRRLGEQAWLESKLTNDPQTTFQGYQDVRVFQGLYLNGQAKFDPLAGIQSQSGIGQVQDSSRIKDLQTQIQTTALQQQLQDLRNGKLLPSDVLTNSGLGGASSNGAPLSAAFPTQDVPTVFQSNNIPALPSPNPTTTLAKLTSIETLDDVKAYRDRIQAYLREQELDDTHDLYGMNLYTLKFDLTVEPGHNNPNYGQLDLTIKTGQGADENTFDNWLEVFRQQLNQESISMQQRYVMHFLNDEEIQQLAILTLKYQDKKNTETAETTKRLNQQVEALQKPTANAAQGNPKLDELHSKAKAMGKMDLSKLSKLNAFSTDLNNFSKRYIETVQPLITELRAQNDTNLPASITTNIDILGLNANLDALQACEGMLKELEDGLPGASGTKAICYLLKDQYQSALANMVEIGTPQPVAYGQANQDGDKIHFFLMNVATNTSSYAGFKILVQKLDNEAAPYVYSVEPKEYEQNISDVAARENFKNMVLSLAAALPQYGVSAGGYANYVKETQTLLNAINRNPLVVGFQNGPTNFGWILGPKFKIGKDQEAHFYHTPEHYSVQASLVVPGWWSNVSFIVTNGWLDCKANVISNSMRTNDLGRVNLPNDLTSLTRAFLGLKNNLLNKPFILPRWDPASTNHNIIVQAGTSPNVLLRGHDLWRNPRVFIGAQPAVSVEILPDMNGLLAKFQDLTMPASLSDGNAQADLTVVTSAGEITLRNGVTILPPSKDTGAKPFAKLVSAYVIKGSAVQFDYDPKLLPKSYNSLVLKAGTAANQLVVVDNANPVLKTNDSRVEAQFSFSKDPVWAGSSTNIYVDMVVKLTPDGDPVPALSPAPAKLVFFADVAESQFTSTNSSDVETNGGKTVTLNLPKNQDLFWEAYPGLKDQFESDSLLVQVSSQDPKHPVAKSFSGIPVYQTAKKDGLEFAASLLIPATLDKGVEFALTVISKPGAKQPVSIVVRDKLKLK